MDFLDYLGIEEGNLYKSLVNLNEELLFLKKLDACYQLLMKRADSIAIEDLDLLVFQLLGFVHYHFYFSNNCLLRGHISESFASMRAAIDATFIAYKIVLQPDTATNYLKRKNAFRNIKGHIKKQNKEDPSSYPLAPPLLKAHEACSQFGSHADISTFFNRLETKRTVVDEKENLEMKFFYFQFPVDVEEFYKYFLYLMNHYLMMLALFFELVKERDEAGKAGFVRFIDALRDELNALQDSRI